MKHLVDIEASRMEYLALPDSEWRKDYFDETTGGYLVTSWKRIEQSIKSNQETKKFDREHQMCMTYAKNGHHLKHLPDKKENGDGTYDTLFDGFRADLKKTKSTNNIIKYASRAINNQGAQIILFEFEEWSNDFKNLIDELVRKGYHGWYCVTDEPKAHRF